MISISIVIPTYNNLEKLKWCVASIQQQLSTNDKLIIVDDGSEDGTFEYFTKKFLKETNVIVLRQKNSGQGPARNFGKKYVDTDYIWFVDSDDFIMRNSMKKIKNNIEKTKYDTYFFDYIEDTGNDYQYHSLTIDPNNKIDLMFTPHFPWNKIIKTELMRTIDFPNEKIRFQDHSTLPIVISQSENIGYISEPLYVYVTGEQGNISKDVKKNDDIYIASDYLVDYLKKQKIKEKELEAIFINTFVFSKLYMFPKNTFKDIFRHCLKLRNYLDKRFPSWNNSLFLKHQHAKKYLHHVPNGNIKLIIGNIYSETTFFTAIILYLKSKPE